MHGEDRMIRCSSTSSATSPNAPAKDVLCMRSVSEYSTHCVRVTGRKAVVTNEPCGLVLQTYRTDFDILQAFWYTFPKKKNDSDGMECLCLAGCEQINFYSLRDDQLFQFVFPFKVRRVFVSSLALLVERVRDVAGEWLPHIFSLSHPYNELLPILYTKKDLPSEWMYCWDGEASCSVVSCSADRLLVFDPSAGLHRLYSMRLSSECESGTVRRRMERRGATPIRDFASPCIRSVVTRSMASRGRNLLSFHSPAVFSNKPTPNRLNYSVGSSRFPLTSTPRIFPFPDTHDDMDDIVSEICLDLIWEDKDISETQASKMFISYDLLGGQYMNCQMEGSLRVLRLSSSSSSLAPPVSIPCVDSFPMDDGRTVVVSCDHQSMTVYSGVIRLGVLGVGVPSPLSVLCSCPSSVLVLAGDGPHLVRLRPRFLSDSARRLWNVLRDTLGSHEKLAAVAVEWENRAPREVDGTDELRDLLCVLLSSCGWRVSSHPLGVLPLSPEGESIASPPISPKHSRTSTTPEDEKHEIIQRTLKATSGAFRGRVSDHAAPPKDDREVLVNVLNSEEEAPLSSMSLLVFQAMHVFYDECRLTMYGPSSLSVLAHFLHLFSRMNGYRLYEEHYARDFPLLLKLKYYRVNNGKKEEIDNADVEMEDSLSEGIVPSRHIFSLHKVPSVCEYLLELLSVNRKWMDARRAPAPSPSSAIPLSSLPPSALLPAPPATPFGCSLIFVVGFGIGAIRDIRCVHRVFGANWSRRLGLVEGKNPLMGIMERGVSLCQMDSVLEAVGWTPWVVRTLAPPLLLLVGSIFTGAKSPPKQLIENGANRNFEFPSRWAMSRVRRLRFSHDTRCENVSMMLDSTRPIFIPLRPSPSDGDAREAHEQFLVTVAYRTVTQAFGRAMLHLRTELPTPNEPIHVPDLCLTGRTHPANLPLDASNSETMKSLREYGEFYNGVSAGLRVVGRATAQPDSEWLGMCHEHEKGPSAAGLLLAFGLAGHITILNMYNVHELLTQQDKLVSISLLLGYAVSLAGSADIQVHKILVTHLPFLMGPTLLDIHIEPILQTTAVFSLGLLFAETAHLSLVNQLINEMGKKAPSDQELPPDRYSYVLCCGFAIGLIALGRGDTMAVNDVPLEQIMPSIADRIVVLLRGGNRSSCVFRTNEGLAWPSAFTSGQSGLPEGESHHVREGPNTNTHVTSPGAAIALGLMFMRTGNKSVSAALSLPNTIFELEEIRPDLVCVRVIARCLIDLDSVEGTEEWLLGNVPPILREYEEMVIGHMNDAFVFRKEHAKYWDNVVDRETVAQYYCYCIAGGCFAMALRFPSTCHPIVGQVLMKYLRIFMPYRGKRDHFSRLCRLAGTSVVSLCVQQVLLAYAVVFAGSGDLSVLRVCRAVRMGENGSIPRRESIHSTHTAAHMALGLLFLGGGRYALKYDNLSIASLVIALYPVATPNIWDNRLYLQPLRFMWNLAVEERLLCPVDSRSDQFVRATATFRFLSGDVRVHDTPCIVPPLPLLREVEIRGVGASHERVLFDVTDEGKAKELLDILTKEHGRLVLVRLAGKEESDIDRDYGVYENECCNDFDEEDLGSSDADTDTILPDALPTPHHSASSRVEARDRTARSAREWRWSLGGVPPLLTTPLAHLVDRVWLSDASECSLPLRSHSIVCRLLSDLRPPRVVDFNFAQALREQAAHAIEQVSDPSIRSILRFGDPWDSFIDRHSFSVS